MSCLNDFPIIRNNLKLAKKTSIGALHKFVFGIEGDRNNRKRLREFPGFNFNDDTVEYTNKVRYINANMNEMDLTSICNVLGLNYNKDNLVKYIFNNLKQNELMQNAEEDDETQSEDDGEIEDVNNDGIEDVNNGSIEDVHVNRLTNAADIKSMSSASNYEDAQPMPNFSRFALNFKDVEDSIRTYDGSGNISIQFWVNEFEEMSDLMHWDELQKTIFAKRSLKGLAKMFVLSEQGLTTWAKLKKALISEFSEQTNSAKLHEMLIARKMQKEETTLQYFYAMKEIASKGNIEEPALIQYIIDGVRDLNMNKSILYGANNIKEFKKKLNDYETFTAKQKMSNPSRTIEKKPFVSAQKDYSKIDMKCYNCGAKGHISSECRNKEKGVKCFNCNTYGHLAKNCSSQKQNTSNSNMRRIVYAKHSMMVNLSINEIAINALFDTGSKYNIIKESLHKKLNFTLTPTSISLYGFGGQESKNGVSAIGSITCKAAIGRNLYDINLLVVADKFMDVDCIVGEKFCKNKIITIDNSGIHFKTNLGLETKNNENEDKQSEREEANDVEYPDIMKIACEYENEINIDSGASIKAKQKVSELINNYTPMQTKSTNVEMKIVVKDETPIYSRPYRLPISERQFVDEQVAKWLEEGIIEPSNSEFTSPVILVKKKDGTPRMCIDYRRINKVVIKDRYPLPLIEDQLDNLKGAVVFSTIDLKNGFFHVPVAKESRKYTSFITHSGQYQFKRVPFGLCNSPSVFQRHVNAVFGDLTREGLAFPYIDDLIITASNEEEAVKKLEKVIATARDYGLQLNIKKCQFLKREVEFLGHIIQNNKISPSPRKVEALLKYEMPKNVKEVQSFLGLAGYFRKFVRNFSTIAKPLSDLLKHDAKFDINAKTIQSFEALKQALCQKPVLGIYDPSLETELHTDASMDGYGAILLQKSSEDGEWHPTYFMSKKTTLQEQKYSSYELEVLAIVESLKKFRVYLLGISFKIITDCDAFTKTMEKRDLSTRVARWVLLLQEFNYTIEHRSGSKMRHVDALSRHPIMIINVENTLDKIRYAQHNDETLRPILQILQQGSTYDDYFLKSKILHKKEGGLEKIVVPKNMEYEIIRNAHNKGHFAIQKTKDLICHEYFISKVDDKIQKHIENCITCILNNRKRGKLEGELHPLPKPDTPLQTYHIDFMGPLETTSKMYKHLLVVVDAFTKFCWLYPTKTTSAACVINKLSLQSVTFGNPAYIITDRGTAFTGEDFKQYCKDEGIQHIKVTTGLPRANGQVERLNAVVAAVLAKCSVQDPSKWYRHVEKVQQYINSSLSRSTTFTPFELLVGVKMNLKEDLHIKKVIEEEIEATFNDERDNMRKEAKQKILKMQEENKKSYNKRRKPATHYKKGDCVAIKRTQLGPGLKLKPKYLGPYTVTNAKINNTYDVEKKGSFEGPNKTTTCAEYMKPWPEMMHSFGSND